MAMLLKLGAAGMFGVAVAMLTLVAYRLIQRKQESIRSGVAGVISMRRADMREQALRDSLIFRFMLPFIAMLAGPVNRLGFEPVKEYLHDPYVKAGYPGGLDDDELVAVGAMMGVVFTILIGYTAAALVGWGWVWLALLGMPMGLLGLQAHLKTRAKEREIEILRALPYMLDLLVLMLRSGTSLRIALGRVVEDYGRHAIGVEFGQVLAEIDVGAPRPDSFRKMSDRLKIADVTSLVDAIVQSEELGWPLAGTLERLADRLNSERLLMAQSKAGSAGVYVMLPSTLVLVATMLILFSPFLVRLLRSNGAWME